VNQDIFFISDLHLALEKKEITRLFISFLDNQARNAKAIYILGDLFDVWIGDDDNTPLKKQIKTRIRQLTDSGTQVFLQLGNRDFLIGQQFCKETGVVLLEDYTVIELNGIKTLLTHGDLLCSDDIAYQAFRKKSHTDAWKQNVLTKPLFVRLIVARWYRFRSYFHKRKKSQDIMDVNQQTVENIMKQHHCLCLIHGHTHRPAIHNFKIGEEVAQRFVLSEWKKEGVKILRWNSEGYDFKKVECELITIN